MKLLNKRINQRGASNLSVLLLICAAVLVGNFVFKAVPVYLQNRTINTIMEDIQKDPSMAGKSSNELKKVFLKRLNTNSIYEFDKENVTVKAERQHMKMRVAYTVQKKYMFNIDILLHFDNAVEIPLN